MISTIKIVVKNLLNDRRGVTAMEYGMIAAATIVAISATLGTIKTGLAAIFTGINTAM
jgi:pilus assembly protein Flp/PilA